MNLKHDGELYNYPLYLVSRVLIEGSQHRPNDVVAWRPSYSGTFNLRIPPDLHAQLAFQAKVRGVTLNSFVMEQLQKAV